MILTDCQYISEGFYSDKSCYIVGYITNFTVKLGTGLVQQLKLLYEINLEQLLNEPIHENHPCIFIT